MPVFNEAPWLKQALTRFREVSWECDIQLIVVNDASTDESLQILQSLQDEFTFEIISHDVNQGKGQAIRTALPYVKGEYTAILDSDLEYWPEDLVSMLQTLINNNYDIIFGNRFEFSTAMTRLHRLRNSLISKFSSVLSNVPLRDVACCLKIIRTELLRKIPLQARRFEIDVELATLTNRYQWKWGEHPVRYHPRTAKEGKKLTWKDGIQVFYSGLLFNESITSLILGASFLLFSFLLIFSFPYGPDPMIDSGRELFVPEALVNGAKLYRDIEYFNGPFSPFFNALGMKIFGATLFTYKLMNSFVLFLIVISFYFLFKRIVSPIAAAMGTLFFICVFAFQLLPVGRMHLYLTPYSQEITHGLLLSLGFLLALFKRRWLLGGVIFALLFLTKAEFSLAATGAVTIYGALNLKTDFKRPLVLFLIGILLILIPVAFYLRTYLPIADVFKAIIGSWYYIFTTKVIYNPYYQALLGKNLLLHQLPEVFLALLALATSLFAFKATFRIHSILRFISLLVCCGILFVYSSDVLHYINLSLGLCSLSFLIFAYLKKYEPNLIAFGTFATILSFKVFFNSWIAGYGFVLAAPAFLWLFLIVPQALRSPSFKWWGGVLGGVLSLNFLFQAIKTLQIETVSLNHQTHSFALEFPHQNLNEVISWIEAKVPADKSMLAFPQGLLLNVLTKRRHPSRYTNFMSAEFDMFGEETILENFRTGRPDYMVLVERWNKTWADMNPDFFKGEYAQSIQQWITENYERQDTFTGHEWRYHLLKNKSAKGLARQTD